MGTGYIKRLAGQQEVLPIRGCANGVFHWCFEYGAHSPFVTTALLTFALKAKRERNMLLFGSELLINIVAQRVQFNGSWYSSSAVGWTAGQLGRAIPMHGHPCEHILVQMSMYACGCQSVRIAFRQVSFKELSK